MYVERTLKWPLAAASRQFPVILIPGPRQVGKTTLLRHAAGAERRYVTLDDPQARTLANDDPGLFLQRFAPPVLIDEIQYAPELLPHIKMIVDSRQQPGDFWLTGSQQFHLMQGVSESLAGRVGIVNLLGFSRRELAGHSEWIEPFLPGDFETGAGDQPLGLMDLYGAIWRGSLPRIALDAEVDRDLFYGSYVQTYLQRDVRALANVGDEMAFTKFLRATAARTGQLLNLADMARDVDVSPNTAKNWLSILKSSGIIYLLEPYYSNVTKRLVKTPKMYFLDTGLAAYLTEWSSPETLEAGAMSGAILESWAVAEVIRSYWHAGRQAPIYFYRDKELREIDLVIFRDGTLYPIEIKKTTAPTKKDIRNFSVLAQLDVPRGPGAVLCLTESPMPITETVWAIPVSQI
ncbi:MAG: ATP-binding protein [Planctomycetaceae bacterium]|nr:ATP-binding protein [Planctomycetaceae bacterium]